MPSPLEGMKVWVAIPSTRGDFHAATVRALLETQEACAKYGIEVEFSIALGSLVHHARTLLANKFLASDYSRIFWIDSDIVWDPVDFITILAHSIRHECVVGIYPRRCDEGGHFMKFVEPDADPNDEGLVQILGCGLGFACVRREVMKHVAATSPALIHGPGTKAVPAVFRQDDDGTEVRGEDYAFWADVTAAGYKIWADPKVTLGHIGNKVYRCSWEKPKRDTA